MLANPFLHANDLDHERRALEAALTECQKKMEQYRAEGDDLAAQLAEADLNAMLERLLVLRG